MRHLTHLAMMMHRLQTCRIVRLRQGTETTGNDVIMIVGIVIVIVESMEVVVVRGVVDASNFEKDKGTPCLTSIITHLTCNCGGADINSTYFTNASCPCVIPPHTSLH